MSTLIIILVSTIVLTTLSLVLFGKYVERGWSQVDEVPHRKEEIKYYTPEEIAKFNEVFDAIREERNKVSRELNNMKK